MSRKYQKRPTHYSKRYCVTSSARYRGKIARSLDDLHCPRKEDERISIDEQRPQPMRRKDLREVRTQA
jgi:hypothetical protein